MKELNNNKYEEVPVQETIELLTTSEIQESCDDSYQRFKEYEILPPFYDEEKFKRGQQFYHKNIFGMFLGKLLGLMTVISTPEVLNVLIFTKMSSEPLTAYKRYLATVFHMCVWYDSDFKPGSELWRSVATIKALHNSASKRSCAAGGQRILQRHMGLTQFGFMGYPIIRPNFLGIHGVTPYELEGFIHLWKVIGYIIGMENRYNICRDSVEETKQICEALIEHTFMTNVKKPHPEFFKMADALVSGMWAMQPFLETKPFVTYMYILLNHNTKNNNKLPFPELSLYERFILGGMKAYTFCFKFAPIKWFANAVQYMSFWLMRNFPFLAYYKYGYENSHVSIYIERGKKVG